VPGGRSTLQGDTPWTTIPTRSTPPIPIIGATSVTQLEDTLGYLDISLSEEQHDRITEAGRIADLSPGAYTFT